MTGRVEAERLGRLAETLAALCLRLKGYRILARRFRTPLGEIDMIARRGRLLVFVEVKARQRMGDALAAISPQQQDRIARGAEWFLGSRPGLEGHDCRFDVFAVALNAWPQHIKNAWMARQRV